MQKTLFTVWIACIGIAAFPQQGQPKLRVKQFFEDPRPIEMTLSTDIRSLRKYSSTPAYQPAVIFCRFPDSSWVHQKIRLRRRGNFRNKNCYLASLMVDFAGQGSTQLSALKKMKWVGGCDRDRSSEQLLLKEYLVYQIYNLLTEKSFRVRLIRATYKDTASRVKPYTQFAFLLEDTKQMAKRNGCREKTGVNFHPGMTDESQMTMVDLFEYMIGNTDWSVTYYHNIKLIVPAEDTLTRPFAVPYDFDYCGFVNAPYAIPPEQLGIHSVTTRLYRGFPRKLEALEATASQFKDKQQQIYDLIDNFGPLEKREKKDIRIFLDPFFKTLSDRNDIKKEFIDNARTR